MASEQELNQFLKSVEKRAFKRALFQVRDTEAALDIVQDSMLKLSMHYSEKPVSELTLLFHRILANTTMDWFRQNKAQNAVLTNLSDFQTSYDGEDFDLLETLELQEHSEATENPAETVSRAQTLREIDAALQDLPERQREAFLLRYWEELDIAQAAAVMGCTEGSVKTHCFRAAQALARALRSKGIRLRE